MHPDLIREDSLVSRAGKLFGRMKTHSREVMTRWPYTRLARSVDDLTTEIIEATRELQAADVTAVS